jgi:ectoine hydroxylase-related dioxygenase (phytanoyl-CoA dioxygenase family)
MADFSGPDLAAARRALAEQGYAVIEGVLAGDQLAAVRDALYRIARFDQSHGWARDYNHDAAASDTLRLWNLISRDPLFCDLAEHELALELVRGLIGWPASLSSSSANIIADDDGALIIHADQTYMPEPWSGVQCVNILWCIDDFTLENGATLVLPGSHLKNRSYQPSDGEDGLIPLEAPAGSMIALDGRLWHSAGRNRTGNPRAGIFNVYTFPIYMPQENWFLSLNPAIRQFGSETLLTLLGFRPELLGRVNGQMGI